MNFTIISNSLDDLLGDVDKDQGLSEDNLKRALDNVQEDTNEYISKLNSIQEIKEKEILD